VRYRKSIVYGAPSVDAVSGEIGEHLERIDDQLGTDKARRVSGIGLAAPLAFGGWRELVGSRRRTPTPGPAAICASACRASRACRLRPQRTRRRPASPNRWLGADAA
jgi:hypothetical protein